MDNNRPVLKQTEDQEIGLLKKELDQFDSKPSLDRTEQIGEKIIMYLRNLFWLAVGALTIYYSNFFHHLFHNPSINELFFQICIAGYTIVVSLMLFTTFIMPRISGTSDVEEYNPKLVSIGAVVGLISVISLLVAIWPVWGWWSFAIFMAIWKGFFSLGVFLPGGDFGNAIFLIINIGTVLSFYFIEHEGYLH